MRDYISKVRKTAYLEMRRIRFIRKYFTTEATKTQVSSLVISCLEYYNYLLADIPQKRIATLQITGFLCLTESNTRLLLCATMLSQVPRLHILQIFVSCTLPPGLSAHLLIHESFTFRSDATNSKGSALFLILALSSGIGYYFLSAML